MASSFLSIPLIVACCISPVFGDGVGTRTTWSWEPKPIDAVDGAAVPFYNHITDSFWVASSSSALVSEFDEDDGSLDDEVELTGVTVGVLAAAVHRVAASSYQLWVVDSASPYTVYTVSRDGATLNDGQIYDLSVQLEESPITGLTSSTYSGTLFVVAASGVLLVMNPAEGSNQAESGFYSYSVRGQVHLPTILPQLLQPGRLGDAEAVVRGLAFADDSGDDERNGSGYLWCLVAAEDATGSSLARWRFAAGDTTVNKGARHYPLVYIEGQDLDVRPVVTGGNGVAVNEDGDEILVMHAGSGSENSFYYFRPHVEEDDDLGTYAYVFAAGAVCAAILMGGTVYGPI